MNAGAIQYTLGADASGLQAAFAKALRFTGGFTDSLKKALSVRGLMDGLAGGLQNALGGSNLGQLVGNSFKAALGKEVLEMRFGAMLGEDAKHAPALLKEMAGRAREAGMQTSELADQGARLAGFGMNASRINETLRMLADITKISGGSVGDLADIYGRAFRDGNVEARELHGLMQSNVNVLGELEKLTGKKVVYQFETRKSFSGWKHN